MESALAGVLHELWFHNTTHRAALTGFWDFKPFIVGICQQTKKQKLNGWSQIPNPANRDDRSRKVKNNKKNVNGPE